MNGFIVDLVDQLVMKQNIKINFVSPLLLKLLTIITILLSYAPVISKG